jgi:hypothetical protein
MKRIENLIAPSDRAYRIVPGTRIERCVWIPWTRNSCEDFGTRAPLKERSSRSKFKEPKES